MSSALLIAPYPRRSPIVFASNLKPLKEITSNANKRFTRSKRKVAPDRIPLCRGQSRRQIFMRRYLDAILETEMLLRVVVEETDTELTVVTLYKHRSSRNLKAAHEG